MKDKMGILFIHGFGGDFSEIEVLYNYLKEKDYIVRFVELAGHDGNRIDMMKASRTEWYNSVIEAYEKLQNEVEVIFVIGFSMGGLLGMQLSFDYSIEGLITLNTPVYYWNGKLIVQNIFHDLKVRKFNHITHYVRSCFKFPVRSLYEFKRLLLEKKRQIRMLTTPILILQAIDDDTVNKSSAEYIFKHTSSSVRKMKFYAVGGHVMLQGTEALKICKDVDRFIQDQLLIKDIE